MESKNQDVEIVTGSYEELLLGFKLVEDNGVYSLEQSFTDHSHTGCVKTVSISRKGILASGGTDEIVRLFNLKKRSELGCLMEHEGAVSCVQFYGGSHLFTASQDKTISIWKTFTWECLRTLKGHKGGVNSISIHPSGKLALSVGQDKCMHTWNLVRGRSAYITNTKQAGELVVWSPSGDSYTIVLNNSLDVYNTEKAQVQCTVTSPGRINSVIYLQNDVIAYAGEGGDIVIYNIKENRELSCIKTNTVRIRGLACSKSPYNNNKLLMVSVSSDGLIKVFEVHSSETEVETNLLTEHNTKFRLTCVAMTPSRGGNSEQPKSSSGKKLKKKEMVKKSLSGIEKEEDDETQLSSDCDDEGDEVLSRKPKKPQSEHKDMKRKKFKRKQKLDREQIPMSKPSSVKKSKKKVSRPSK